MITLVSKLHRDIFWGDLADFDRPKPGDQLHVILNNDEQVVFDVTKDESGQLFFVTNDCIATSRIMGYETNVNGWQGMSLRHYLNNDLFALLPEKLQTMIVPTKIVQVVRGQRIECRDKVFCLSKTQVFGQEYSNKDVWAAVEPEDSQLEVFKNHKNRIKMTGIKGKVCAWWLRSPYMGDLKRFSLVSNLGLHGYDEAGFRWGVCFSFCIQS